ncbi:hypothetical protein MXB_2938 [Myxobolus squamalis]|nr:hypothetical protein MXB_2938 [Myxobolus squamalis]
MSLEPNPVLYTLISSIIKHSIRVNESVLMRSLKYALVEESENELLNRALATPFNETAISIIIWNEKECQLTLSEIKFLILYCSKRLGTCYNSSATKELASSCPHIGIFIDTCQNSLINLVSWLNLIISTIFLHHRQDFTDWIFIKRLNSRVSNMCKFLKNLGKLDAYVYYPLERTDERKPKQNFSTSYYVDYVNF